MCGTGWEFREEKMKRNKAHDIAIQYIISYHYGTMLLDAHPVLFFAARDGGMRHCFLLFFSPCSVLSLRMTDKRSYLLPSVLG